MCVKKLSSEDKEKINKKYDEMCDVIVNNKKEEEDVESMKYQTFLK
jgi:hypothetical protein